MLVLSRRAGESLMIGSDIEITVTKISKRRVSLAIVAPRGVKVLRRELRSLLAPPTESPATVPTSIPTSH